MIYALFSACTSSDFVLEGGPEKSGMLVVNHANNRASLE